MLICFWGSGHQDECLGSGMDGYLAKPIRKDALMLTLLKYVKPSSS
jgi:CheY-like chemotaxis protein